MPTKSANDAMEELNTHIARYAADKDSVLSAVTATPDSDGKPQAFNNHGCGCVKLDRFTNPNADNVLLSKPIFIIFVSPLFHRLFLLH
jgi:hypothetical protein